MKKKYLFFWFCLLLFFLGDAQIIITIAGNHAAGYSGDNSPAINAELNQPQGVAVDDLGNVYVADYNNHVIRKISTSGIITTFAGTGTAGFSGDGFQATSATLRNPMGLTFDSFGNLYIADVSNQRIRKVNTSGIISTVAGNGSWGYSGNGNLATSAKLFWPTDVDVDLAGNIYISDSNNNVIRKVNTSGIITTVAGSGYLATTGSGDYGGDGGLADTAKLNRPYGVAVDGIGNIFIADGYNNRIRKVNTSGIITTVAGTGVASSWGDGVLATTVPISFAAAVDVDAIGNLLIADLNGSTIRKVDTSGIIRTVAGVTHTYGYSGDGGISTNATLNFPRAVTHDLSGNIYIADSDNHVVRKVGNCIPSIPSICMVEVDDLSQNNVVYWDKSLYPSADTMYIYRDTSNNNYAQIGKVAASSLSIFVDTVRSLYDANGDPNVTFWRYKIAFTDTCGGGRVLSPMSPWHQTIYQYNIGGLFIWNHYEIEGQPTPVPGLQNYLLKRDNNATGTFITAATASAASTNINDVQYSTYQSTADWRVETNWTISCNPTLRVGNDGKENDIQTVFVKSKSNIKNNRTVGVKDGKNQSARLKVYPNPANDLLNVEVSLLNDKEATIVIENMLGQVVYTMQTNKPINSINTSNLISGVYFIKVNTGKGVVVEKIIIE